MNPHGGRGQPSRRRPGRGGARGGGYVPSNPYQTDLSEPLAAPPVDYAAYSQPPPSLHAAAPAPTPSAPPDPEAQVRAVLSRFGITIAKASELLVLQDYDIVVVADDSGSMSMAAVPVQMRKVGQPTPTRWDELKNTLHCMIDIATCFDQNGIDLYFLNRGSVDSVTSVSDARLADIFSRKPSGSTPLTRALQSAVCHSSGEKPLLVVIATDGEPDGGAASFCDVVGRLLKEHPKLKIQIMACTDDDDSIGWMNTLDKKFRAVDVTDDFYSEKREVLRAGKVRAFERPDWVIKALLGPVSKKFDSSDEKQSGCCTVL